MVLLKLFLAFCKIGLFCVGGGYASMPLIQQEIVIKLHWLSMKELIDIFAISQMTPGPVGINAATFVGTKVAGVSGAIVATLGFITPSVVIMIILAKIYEKYKDVSFVQGLLRGVRPAVVALIASAGVMFLVIVLFNQEYPPINWQNFQYKEFIILIVALCLTRVKRVGVIFNLLICGVLSVILG